MGTHENNEGNEREKRWSEKEQFSSSFSFTPDSDVLPNFLIPIKTHSTTNTHNYLLKLIMSTNFITEENSRKSIVSFFPSDCGQLISGALSLSSQHGQYFLFFHFQQVYYCQQPATTAHNPSHLLLLQKNK